ENMTNQHLVGIAYGGEVVRFIPFVQHIDIGHQLIFLVIGERNTCLFQQTREFIEHGGYLLRNLSGGWRFANPPYGFSRPGKRSATGQFSEHYALRRSIPCFFSHTSRIEIAAGVTPEIREAWPIDTGL